MRRRLHLDHYAPADQEALYEVCLRTGRAGEDATFAHDDPELLGHLYLGAYLAIAPELASVLRPEGDGEDPTRPIGYVVGTPDTRLFEEACEQRWWPALRRRYPLDAPYRPADAALVHQIHAPRRTEASWLSAYPAHLHVDVLPEGRGAGHGRALLERFLDTLRARKVPGLHLGVDPANTHAIGFYRHLGMEVLEEGRGRLTLGMAWAA